MESASQAVEATRHWQVRTARALGAPNFLAGASPIEPIGWVSKEDHHATGRTGVMVCMMVSHGYLLQ